MSIACFTTSPIVAYYLYIKGKCALNEWLLWCLKLILQQNYEFKMCYKMQDFKISYSYYNDEILVSWNVYFIDIYREFTFIIFNINAFDINVLIKAFLSLQLRELLRYIISRQSQFISLCEQIWYGNNEGIAFGFVSFYCTPIYLFI